MTRAIVRPPGRSYPDCIVRGGDRPAIDLALARIQHAEYVRGLASLGFDVVSLPPEPDLPDACFVEDVALLLPEVAVLLSPGTASRAPEVAAIAPAVADLRANVVPIRSPARIDGGDLLRVGRTIYVGLSSRTDAGGLEALGRAISPFGWSVRALPVRRGLHLQSAVSAAGDLVLAEPGAVDAGAIDARVVFVEGPVNFVAHAGAVLCAASAVHAAEALAKAGLRVGSVDLSEFEKGDAGPTCLSLRECTPA